ncbi:MAG: hypothetical protein RJQ09_14690 [Cyclobacteriaceae bacterium]
MNLKTYIAKTLFLIVLAAFSIEVAADIYLPFKHKVEIADFETEKEDKKEEDKTDKVVEQNADVILVSAKRLNSKYLHFNIHQSLSGEVISPPPEG